MMDKITIIAPHKNNYEERTTTCAVEPGDTVYVSPEPCNSQGHYRALIDPDVMDRGKWRKATVAETRHLVDRDGYGRWFMTVGEIPSRFPI
jgi:hypothetical protein